MSCLFIVLFCLLIVVYNIVQWGQCFPHSAQWGKCFPHCAEWGKHFPHSRNFFEKCSESSDSSRKLKISKSIFPIQNGSKHLNFFFKIGCFQKKFKIFWKMLRIFWFIQKMKNLKIYIFQYKMGQNTCKFFKNRIFQK